MGEGAKRPVHTVNGSESATSDSRGASASRSRIQQLDLGRPLDPDVRDRRSGCPPRSPGRSSSCTCRRSPRPRSARGTRARTRPGSTASSPPLVVELDALPLAERRRAAAQVDDDVEHAPAGHAHELALARDASGSGCRAASPGASASGCPGRTPSGCRVRARHRRGTSPRRSRARRRARWVRAGRGRRVESQAVALAGRRLGSDRRKIASPCRGPPPCPRPPAATRRFRRTSPHASTSSRARRRTSPSTSSTISTRSPSTPPRSSPAARTRRQLDRRALQPGARLRGLPGAAGGGARGVPPPPPDGARRRRRPTPLFSLDQSPFEQAVAADHVNVEDTARRVSRSEVDGAIEAIAAAERILIAGTDQMAFFASYLRHLLMLLDVRAEIAASPSQEALSRLGRIDERTLVIGLSAGRPHPLVVRAMKIARHRRANTLAIVDATLSDVSKLSERTLYYSIELAGLRALAHRPAVDPAGARLRRLRARHRAVRRPHPRVPAQVGPSLDAVLGLPDGITALPVRPRRRPDEHGGGPRAGVEADVRGRPGYRRSTRAPTTTRYVDGKPREDGIRDFLASRDVAPVRGRGRRGSATSKNDLVLQLIHERASRRSRARVRYLEAATRRGAARAPSSPRATTRRRCSRSPASTASSRRAWTATSSDDARPARQAGAGHVPRRREAARRRAGAGRGVRGRAGRRRRRAAPGSFGHVVGVDRVGQREALLEHGADVVVDDLAELL